MATNGYNAHELTAIELATGKKGRAESAPQSWFGLAADRSDEAAVVVRRRRCRRALVRFQDGKLEPRDTYPAGRQVADRSRRRISGDRHCNHRLSHRASISMARPSTLFSLTILAKGGNKSFAWGDATTDKGAGGAITGRSRHILSVAENSRRACTDFRFAAASGPMTS